MGEAGQAGRHQRHNVSLFVGSAGQDTEPFGHARNLSLSGVFLETAARPAVDSMRELVFIWGDDTLTCSARVVRHAPDGVGLAFIDPEPAFVHLLREILDTSPAVEIVNAKSRG